MIIVERLMWNDQNIAHIARHEVTTAEVEEVCHGAYEVFQTYAGRLTIVGSTSSGRMLFIVVVPKGGGDYLPITARVADRKERQRYEIARGGEKNGLF